MQGGLEHIDTIRFYERSDCLILDSVSVRNLELVDPLFSGESAQTTLFHTLDACSTPMGKRLLRATLVRPSANLAEINARLDAVAEAAADLRRREAVRRAMDGLLDLERLLGRVALDSAGPREVMALAATLFCLPAVQVAAASFNSLKWQQLMYPRSPRHRAPRIAGLHPDARGVRLHLNIKISTGSRERLLAAALQQQLRAAGIALSIRSRRVGTFYSDVTAARRSSIHSNGSAPTKTPTSSTTMYSSSSLPPRGANRGHYINPRIDALLAQAAAESGPDADTSRRADYIAIQKILATDLPTIPLWFPSSSLVHSHTRLPNATANLSGNFDFLR